MEVRRKEHQFHVSLPPFLPPLLHHPLNNMKVATPLKGQEKDIDAQIQEAVEKKLQQAVSAMYSTPCTKV